MEKAIKVVAQPRKEQGSSPSRRLRKRGLLPGVVYGSGKKAQLVELNAHDFERILAHHTSESLMMDLQVGDDTPKKVLLKEVQHHPVTGAVIHADFHEIAMDRKLRVMIPVELSGEPIGVSQQGGVLEQLIRAVEVECLPADILERIEMDVTPLEVGHRLAVGDIKLDAQKYTIVTPANEALASVAIPRAVEEEVPAEEAAAPEAAVAAAEGEAEPEVIGEKEREKAREEKEATKGAGQKGAAPKGAEGREAGAAREGREPRAGREGREGRGKG